MIRKMYTILVAATLLSIPKLHAQDGTLDATFNTAGTMLSNFSNATASFQSTVIQPDGKMVCIGTVTASTSTISTYDFLVVRINTNGTIDNTFGTNGVVKLDFSMSYDVATAVALQADGKIVVAGKTTPTGTGDDFGIARFNANGSIDNTFGNSGKATFDFNNTVDDCSELLIQPDGKIIVAGLSSSNTTGTFAALRLTTSGALDNTFGTAGKLTTAFTGNSYASGIALQPDGKLVFSGVDIVSGTPGITVARYSANGVLDASFGNAGKFTYNSPVAAIVTNAMLLQADGKIVLGGSFQNDFALMRLKTNGTTDSTFGTNGIVQTDFGYSEVIYALALQTDGKIIAAGHSVNGTTSTSNFALAKYTTTGSLDATFGTGGKVTTTPGTQHNYLYGVALTTDGKIVAAGTSNDGVLATVARYKNSVTPTPTTVLPNGGPLANLQIYPNPASNELKIAANGLQLLSAEIFGMNGQIVCRPVINNALINISALPASLYYLRLKTNAGGYTTKFVKE